MVDFFPPLSLPALFFFSERACGGVKFRGESKEAVAEICWNDGVTSSDQKPAREPERSGLT